MPCSSAPLYLDGVTRLPNERTSIGGLKNRKARTQGSRLYRYHYHYHYWPLWAFHRHHRSLIQCWYSCKDEPLTLAWYTSRSCKEKSWPYLKPDRARVMPLLLSMFLLLHASKNSTWPLLFISNSWRLLELNNGLAKSTHITLTRA